jgi:flagellar hook-length control protein FliK
MDSSSGKAKNIAGTRSVATDHAIATKIKTAPKAIASVPVASVVFTSASPTPPAQVPAAIAPQAEARLVAGATPPDGVLGTIAALITPGDKTADDAPVSVNSANQSAGPDDPSTQNVQLNANAVSAATTALHAIAVAASVPTVPTPSSKLDSDGPSNDLLVVADGATGKNGGAPSVVPSLRSVPAPPVLIGGTPPPVITDALGKTVAPGGDPPPRKANAILPTEPASPIKTAAGPAIAQVSGTEQSPGNASVDVPAAAASTGIEPEDRARDVIKQPDSSAGAGLVIQAQTASVASAAATNNSTGPATPSQSATAPVPVAEVAVTIAAQAQSGKSRFEIRLDPPELGRIDVQLNVDSRGTVTSRLIVERPETLNLLVRDAPQLQRALQDAGLNAAADMQFSLADQGFTSRNGLAQQNEVARRPSSGGTTDDTVPITAVQGYTARAGRNGGLDITV